MGNTAVPLPTPPPGSTPMDALPPPPAGSTPVQPVVNVPTQPSTTPEKPEILRDLAAGYATEMAKTATGALNLAGGAIEKLRGLPEGSLTPSVVEPENRSLARTAGGLAENVAEFAGGEELVKGAASLLKLSQYAPEALALIEKFPKASRLLLNTFIGGAQGSLKAEGEGESSRKGAEAGAAGAAAGSALAEETGPALRWMARKTGLGGLTGLEAMVKAGRAYVGEQNWEENVTRALPRLVNATKETGVGAIKKVGDFVNLIDTTKNNLWNDVIAPQVERHAGEMISGEPIAQAVEKQITPAMAAMPATFRTEIAAIQGIASDFKDFNFSLGQADEFLHTLNAKLSSFYRMTPEARHATGLTDGEAAGLEAAADAIREQLYGKLADLGEKTPGEFRREYGALKQMSRVFEKRATVADREAPINLSQQIAAWGGLGEALWAILSGHSLAASIGVGAASPLAAAALRARQAPASLVRQGLRAAGREIEGPGPIREAVGATARAVLPALGRAAADFTRFEASDGSIHDVPTEHLDRAREIDPGLRVLEPPPPVGATQ